MEDSTLMQNVLWQEIQKMFVSSEIKTSWTTWSLSDKHQIEKVWAQMIKADATPTSELVLQLRELNLVGWGSLVFMFTLTSPKSLRVDVEGGSDPTAAEHIQYRQRVCVCVCVRVLSFPKKSSSIEAGWTLWYTHTHTHTHTQFLTSSCSPVTHHTRKITGTSLTHAHTGTLEISFPNTYTHTPTHTLSLFHKAPTALKLCVYESVLVCVCVCVSECVK